MSKDRENNYDLLRFISILAVIALHISDQYSDFGDTYKMTLTIWSKIVAFCVPCFVMLSGAFILNNEKNAYYSNFYRKSFSKIGIHVLIFSILYVAYH